MTRCDRTEAWAALAGHYQAHGRGFDLREAFARDPGRFAALSLQAPEVFADLSKNRLDLATLRFLFDLARECGVEAFGIDISEYAIGQVHADIRAFCSQGSIAAPFGR